LGVGIVSGVFAAIACGSPDPALNPAVTLGVAIETGVSRNNSVPGGADAGRYGRRVSRVAELPAPLEPNGRSCAKLTCFSTMPAIQDFGANLLSEIIGTFMLVLGVVAISSKKGGD
jgi:glycerol uptake facilitator protein